MRGVAETVENTPPARTRMEVELNSSGFEPVRSIEYVEDRVIDELFVQVQGDERPFVRVSVMGREMLGLLDSGAQCSVLGNGSENFVKSMKLTLYPSSVKVKTAGGNCVPVKGYVHLPITFNNTTKIINTLVAPELKRKLILGYGDFWKAFEVRPSVPMEVSIEEMEC